MPMRRPTSHWGRSIAVGVLLTILVGVGGLLVASLLGFPMANRLHPPARTNTSTPHSTQGRGTITGRATDAKGQVPADLQVCAAPNLGGTSTCVAPGSSDGTFYLSVSPGQYTVTAVVGSQPRDHGTYTEAVAGITTRHRAMVLDVAENQTLTNVNPIDWTK